MNLPLRCMVGLLLAGMAVRVCAQRALPNAPSATAALQQAPQGETEEERKARLKAEAEREVKTEEKQRILAVVPNFNTVENGQGVALTKWEKMRLAGRASIDPFQFAGAAVLAGFSEVTDSDRGYGWGPGGFGKRVGANFANEFDGTILSNAVFPILFRQDPRYFRKGTGRFHARVVHALLSAVVCRGDNGRTQVNYSNVAGNVSAGLISNLYYPADETGVRLSLANAAVTTAEGALGSVGLEFAPDVGAWWKRRKMRQRNRVAGIK